MHFANTVMIRRPRPEVFEYIADFRNVPKWNYAIEETEQSPGPTRIGTTIRQVRSIPRKNVETLEVTGFERDRRIEVRGTLGPFDGLMLYEFESIGDGTRLTNEANLNAHGLFAVAAPLAAGRVREAVAENLSALKRLLETTG